MRDGNWRERVIFDFPGGNEGANPFAGPVIDRAGNLFGTTVLGCLWDKGHIYGKGAIYELSPRPNGNWVESVLYRFPGAVFGANPYGGLAFDANDDILATATYGGLSEAGSVIEILR